MTAKIKLNAASGGGSFSLQAPSSSANNRVFTLPDLADATMATVKTLLLAEEEGACKLKDPPPDAAFSLIFAVMV
jgi:hypothetical protein